MSDGYPSMTALLGLLAVAGYQNRDKIAEMLGGLTGHQAVSPPAAQSAPTVPNAPPSGLAGVLSNLGGSDAGGFLSGGLGSLMRQFDQAGHGEIVRSWVGQGANQPVAPHQVEQAIGPDLLATLVQKTGLSRDELLARLSSTLPQAIDRYTPDGRLPA